MKTYDQYVQHILKDIERRKSVDYGDKNSVRRYNAAYDRMARDVSSIEKLYPDRIDNLFELIYHPDSAIAETIAWFVIYRNSFSHEQKQNAVILIEHLLFSGAIKGVDAISTEFALRALKQTTDLT